METNAVLYKKGVDCYHARNFSDAEKIFRRLLADNPRDAQSLHMMAAIGYEVERYDFAEELIKMALAEDKSNPAFYFTLGAIQKKQAKIEDALFNFQKTIELKPDHLDALLEIAQICRDQGALHRNDNMLEAALSFFTRALAIRADIGTYTNMGYIYYLLGNFRDAVQVSKACFARHPDSVSSLLSIANFSYLLGEYEEALEYYEKVLVLQPDHGDNYANMASALKSLGRLDEAIAMQKKAISLAPENYWVRSNMLLAMVYAASVTPEEIAQTARQFGEFIADPLRRTRSFSNNKNPDRKLRIGYVSPDFRKHAVSYFLAPVFKCNKDQFEIFAYSKNETDDEVTENLKTYFDHWRDIKYATDDAAADMIETDKIDILVDLAGHTGRNGLMIFARKPAPIQITWLGYPATTGMKVMDYRITDSYAEPPGMTEHLNTETLWRLPDIFCVYGTDENGPPVIDHPPFEDNGYITFGCFNNFTKVTDPVLQTWAKIMERVSNSKLLLEIPGIESQKIKSEIERRLSQHGLPIERVILEPKSRANQYVLYNKIDIALDPFPCNGGTTSMDTLWMGVPFVTLAGKHFVSRMGVTILSNVGLQELIAQTIDDYISITVNLAQDNAKLRNLRRHLRERTASSPLMDQEKFTRNIESAYREMWNIWVKIEQEKNAE